MLNCDQCLSRCKAACCGIIPFDKNFIKKHKPVREVLKTIEIDEKTVVLETENMRCPYLNKDFKCSIYKYRLDVCKLYGNEKQINLTCQYQDKDGRLRGRQERRSIEREIVRFMNYFIKNEK